MRKRILSVLLCLCLLCGIFPGGVVFAAEYIGDGPCGENVTWELDSDGVLTISGQGAMTDYSAEMPLWSDYAESITEVIIETGVTSIGSYAFSGCSELTTVTIAGSVESIGEYAFGYCRSLKVVEFKGDAMPIAGTAFEGCEVICYYPADNDTWLQSETQEYGGTLKLIEKAFELYYTFGNSITDADNNKYHDVVAGNTVTAEIYVKNNRREPQILEGYDIDIAYSEYLQPETKITVGITAVDEDANEINIQYIGQELSREIKTGEAVRIASVEYTVANDVGSDVKMPITIIFGALAIDNTALDITPAITTTCLGVNTLAQYTVMFDSNGGSTVTSQTINFGGKATEPTAPTKEGYTFAGWYNGDTPWDFTAVVTEDMTLYAKWTPNTYTLTFKDGDGTVDTVSFNVETQSITPPELPSKIGYTAAWGAYDLKKAEDQTVNVVYTPITYTIKFYLNSGIGTVPNDITATYDAEIELPDGTGFSRTDYAFLGWNTEAGATTALQVPVKNLSSTAGATVALYAVWEDTVNEVTFVTNSDDTENFKTKVQKGQAIAQPVNVTKTGYTFAGWYTDSRFTNKWEFTAVVTEDMTLYAKWTPIEYTITYVYGKGIETSTEAYTIETSITMPDTTTTGNYKISKWKVTTADGNWIADTTFDTNAKLGDKYYGNVTLTAEWESVIDYKLEAYTYAYDTETEALLIVNAEGLAEDEGYAVNGNDMYYLADAAGYMANAEKGVYLYIVKAADFNADMLEEVAKTDDMILDKSSGDVNGNGRIDIGDANAVYQMLKDGGDEYTMDQISIKGRLIADQVKTNDVKDSHASVEDAVAIVNAYNASKLMG